MSKKETKNEIDAIEDEWSIASLHLIKKYISRKVFKEKFEEISTIPCKCYNCGYKDLLGKFLKPYSMHTHWDDESIGKWQNLLECPKCGSSYILIKESMLMYYKL